MKQILVVFITLISISTYAQTGSITGVITDKEFNDEPLPQANVVIKGTEKGTVTDFDGLFSIEKIDDGNYTLEVSFIGYETKNIPVTVANGEKTTITISLAGSAVAMDEVVIKASTSTKRETETALLVQQKKAVEIKESIGAEQLAKLGVSDASAATTKISGVTKSEGSGDVFVRGLGDRYLYTTLNGLPIPSDDVEKKNINLGLFSTRLISSVDISKTTSANSSADQASGNIDIKTKEMTGDDFLKVSVSSGLNTNVFEEDSFSNFKTTANYENIQLGFYSKPMRTSKAILNQTWATSNDNNPINRSISVSYGKKIKDNTKLLLSVGQNSNYNYTNGLFRDYDNNILTDSIFDVINWRKNINTTALLDLTQKFNDKHSGKITSLLVNKSTDQVYEGGRLGNAIIQDETSAESGLFQFIRDQNTKTTMLFVGQLHTSHRIGEKQKLDFSTGYNILNANEPNRIRNQANFNINTGETVLPTTGGDFQQRKTLQLITDNEYNARINDELLIIEDNTEEGNGKSLKVNLGLNYRRKTRDFKSQFFGVTKSNTYNQVVDLGSIDELHKLFTQENIDKGIISTSELPKDKYDGKLQSIAAYSDFNLNLGKFTSQVGLRFQKDNIDINYDVGTLLIREGSTSKEYMNLYPSVNLKYVINNKHSLRFSNSYTITLPEFKEIAPFEYAPPVGQEVAGNPNLEASKNINYDIKWEFFPSRSELLSLTSFYKTIDNPINKVMERSASQRLSFFNSGEQARIYGIETELRLDLIKEDDEAETPSNSLKLNLNASKMWHEQDLISKSFDDGTVLTYQYNGRRYERLQGASDWIGNISLNFNTNTERPFDATITANYASAKIFALGNPLNQFKSDIAFNESIVEEGFTVLDLVFSKEINNDLSIKLSAKNLLNPEIKRTQLINKNVTNRGSAKKQTVFSYKRGTQIKLSLNYQF